MNNTLNAEIVIMLSEHSSNTAVSAESVFYGDVANKQTQGLMRNEYVHGVKKDTRHTRSRKKDKKRMRMPDRETVINIYANCILNDKQCCSGCYTGGPGLGIACRQKVLTDAFYLLKEQEAVEPKITTLLKKDHDDSHIYRCGNCDMIIFKSHKYCPFCGQAVKWE